jgi:hypothetical protein
MLARRVALAALIATAWGAQPAVAQKTAATTLEMKAEGEVQIAPDGTVSDYRLQSKLAPAVAELVDKDVRRWQFQPIVVDGTPVVAKTSMHLDLKAEPVDDKDGYRIRVVNVRFGEPKRSPDMRPPHYPEAAVSAHLGAKVLLAVRLDETGNVTDALPVQTSLDGRASSENEAERWRKLFEQASVTAARSWRYDLGEKINGKTVGTSAIVPVVFYLTDLASAPRPGTWKQYLPGPMHTVPWMGDRQLAGNESLSALGDGQALSLDSRFHLKDDVIGKTL